MNKRRPYISLLLIILALMPALGIKAQSAFQSGEVLYYNFYFNWKFVWVKAGSATWSVTRTFHDGADAYRSRLLLRTSTEADKYFMLRDTLTSVVSIDKLRPLHYLKSDLEGSSHRRREVWYSYPGNKCRVKQQYIHKNGEVTDKDETMAAQVYDMLSIILNARTFDISSWKAGKRINIPVTDGRGVKDHTIIYRGKENVKMKDSETTYRCIKLSLMETTDGKENEIDTFLATDDANHLPVRLDLNLRFGTAKAYLAGSKGLKNPVRARVK